jgi:hypothetical protein
MADDPDGHAAAAEAAKDGPIVVLREEVAAKVKNSYTGPMWAAGDVRTMHESKRDYAMFGEDRVKMAGFQSYAMEKDLDQRLKDRDELLGMKNMQWDATQPDPRALGVEHGGGKARAKNLAKRKFWRLRYEKKNLKVLRKAGNIIDSQVSRAAYVQALVATSTHEPPIHPCCCCIPMKSTPSCIKKKCLGLPLDDHWAWKKKMTITHIVRKRRGGCLRSKKLQEKKIKVPLPCPHCNQVHPSYGDIMYPHFVFAEKSNPSIDNVHAQLGKRVRTFQKRWRSNKRRSKLMWCLGKKKPIKIKHVWRRKHLKVKRKWYDRFGVIDLPGKHRQLETGLTTGQQLDKMEMGTAVTHRKSKLRYLIMKPLKIHDAHHKTSLAYALATELRHLAGIPTYKRGMLLEPQRALVYDMQDRGEKCVLILDLFVRLIGPGRPDSHDARVNQHNMKNIVLKAGVLDALMALLEKELDSMGAGRDQYDVCKARSAALQRISHPGVFSGFYACETPIKSDQREFACLLCRLWNCGCGCVSLKTKLDEFGNPNPDTAPTDPRCTRPKNEWKKVQIDEMAMCILRGLTISWLVEDSRTGVSEDRCKKISDYIKENPVVLNKIKYYHQTFQSYGNKDMERDSYTTMKKTFPNWRDKGIQKEDTPAKPVQQDPATGKPRIWLKGTKVVISREDEHQHHAEDAKKHKFCTSTLRDDNGGMITDWIPSKYLHATVEGETRVKKRTYVFGIPYLYKQGFRVWSKVGDHKIIETSSKPEKRPRYGAPTNSDQLRFWNNMLIGGSDWFKGYVRQRYPGLMRHVLKHWEDILDEENMVFVLSILSAMSDKNEHITGLLLGGYDQQVLAKQERASNPDAALFNKFLELYKAADLKTVDAGDDAGVWHAKVGVCYRFLAAMVGSIQESKCATAGMHWAYLVDIPDIGRKVSLDKYLLAQKGSASLNLFFSCVAQMRLYTDLSRAKNGVVEGDVMLAEDLASRLSMLEEAVYVAGKRYPKASNLVAKFNPGTDTEGHFDPGINAIVYASEALETLRGMLFVPSIKKVMMGDGGRSPTIAARFLYTVEQSFSVNEKKPEKLKQMKKDQLCALRFLTCALLSDVGSSVNRDWYNEITGAGSLTDARAIGSAVAIIFPSFEEAEEDAAPQAVRVAPIAPAESASEEAAGEAGSKKVVRTKKRAKKKAAAKKSNWSGTDQNKRLVDVRAGIKAMKKKLKKDKTCPSSVLPSSVKFVRSGGKIPIGRTLDTVILMANTHPQVRSEALVAKALLFIGDPDNDEARDIRPWTIFPGLNPASARFQGSESDPEQWKYAPLTKTLFDQNPKDPAGILAQFMYCETMIKLKFHNVPAPRSLSEEVAFPRTEDVEAIRNLLKVALDLKPNPLSAQVRADYVIMNVQGEQDLVDERYAEVIVEMYLPYATASGQPIHALSRPEGAGMFVPVMAFRMQEVVNKYWGAGRSAALLPFRAARPPRVRATSKSAGSWFNCDTFIIVPTLEPDPRTVIDTMPNPGRKPPEPTPYTGRRQQNAAVHSMIQAWRENQGKTSGATMNLANNKFHKRVVNAFKQAEIGVNDGLKRLGDVVKDALSSKIEICPEDSIVEGVNRHPASAKEFFESTADANNQSANPYHRLEKWEAYRPKDPDKPEGTLQKTNIGVYYPKDGLLTANRVDPKFKRTPDYWRTITETTAYNHRNLPLKLLKHGTAGSGAKVKHMMDPVRSTLKRSDLLRARTDKHKLITVDYQGNIEVANDNKGKIPALEERRDWPTIAMVAKEDVERDLYQQIFGTPKPTNAPDDKKKKKVDVKDPVPRKFQLTFWAGNKNKWVATEINLSTGQPTKDPSGNGVQEYEADQVQDGTELPPEKRPKIVVPPRSAKTHPDDPIVFIYFDEKDAPADKDSVTITGKLKSLPKYTLVEENRWRLSTDMFQIIWQLMWDQAKLDTINQFYQDEYCDSVFRNKHRTRKQVGIRLNRLKEACHVKEAHGKRPLAWLEKHISDFLASMQVVSPLYLWTLAAEIDPQDPLFEDGLIDKVVTCEGSAEMWLREREEDWRRREWVSLSDSSKLMSDKDDLDETLADDNGHKNMDTARRLRMSKDKKKNPLTHENSQYWQPGSVWRSVGSDDELNPERLVNIMLYTDKHATTAGTHVVTSSLAHRFGLRNTFKTVNDATSGPDKGWQLLPDGSTGAAGNDKFADTMKEHNSKTGKGGKARWIVKSDVKFSKIEVLGDMQKVWMPGDKDKNSPMRRLRNQAQAKEDIKLWHSNADHQLEKRAKIIEKFSEGWQEVTKDPGKNMPFEQWCPMEVTIRMDKYVCAKARRLLGDAKSKAKANYIDFLNLHKNGAYLCEKCSKTYVKQRYTATKDDVIHALRASQRSQSKVPTERKSLEARSMHNLLVDLADEPTREPFNTFDVVPQLEHRAHLYVYEEERSHQWLESLEFDRTTGTLIAWVPYMPHYTWCADGHRPPRYGEPDFQNAKNRGSNDDQYVYDPDNDEEDILYDRLFGGNDHGREYTDFQMLLVPHPKKKHGRLSKCISNALETTAKQMKTRRQVLFEKIGINKKTTLGRSAIFDCTRTAIVDENMRQQIILRLNAPYDVHRRCYVPSARRIRERPFPKCYPCFMQHKIQKDAVQFSEHARVPVGLGPLDATTTIFFRDPKLAYEKFLMPAIIHHPEKYTKWHKKSPLNTECRIRAQHAGFAAGMNDRKPWKCNRLVIAKALVRYISTCPDFVMQFDQTLSVQPTSLIKVGHQFKYTVSSGCPRETMNMMLHMYEMMMAASMCQYVVPIDLDHALIKDNLAVLQLLTAIDRKTFGYREMPRKPAEVVELDVAEVAYFSKSANAELKEDLLAFAEGLTDRLQGGDKQNNESVAAIWKKHAEGDSGTANVAQDYGGDIAWNDALVDVHTQVQFVGNLNNREFRAWFARGSGYSKDPRHKNDPSFKKFMEWFDGARTAFLQRLDVWSPVKVSADWEDLVDLMAPVHVSTQRGADELKPFRLRRCLVRKTNNPLFQIRSKGKNKKRGKSAPGFIKPKFKIGLTFSNLKGSKLRADLDPLSASGTETAAEKFNVVKDGAFCSNDGKMLALEIMANEHLVVPQRDSQDTDVVNVGGCIRFDAGDDGDERVNEKYWYVQSIEPWTTHERLGGDTFDELQRMFNTTLGLAGKAGYKAIEEQIEASKAKGETLEIGSMIKLNLGDHTEQVSLADIQTATMVGHRCTVRDMAEAKVADLRTAIAHKFPEYPVHLQRLYAHEKRFGFEMDHRLLVDVMTKDTELALLRNPVIAVLKQTTYYEKETTKFENPVGDKFKDRLNAYMQPDGVAKEQWRLKHCWHITKVDQDPKSTVLALNVTVEYDPQEDPAQQTPDKNSPMVMLRSLEELVKLFRSVYALEDARLRKVRNYFLSGAHSENPNADHQELYETLIGMYPYGGQTMMDPGIGGDWSNWPGVGVDCADVVRASAYSFYIDERRHDFEIDGVRMGTGARVLMKSAALFVTEGTTFFRVDRTTGKESNIDFPSSKVKVIELPRAKQTAAKQNDILMRNFAIQESDERIEERHHMECPAGIYTVRLGTDMIEVGDKIFREVFLIEADDYFVEYDSPLWATKPKYAWETGYKDTLKTELTNRDVYPFAAERRWVSEKDTDDDDDEEGVSDMNGELVCYITDVGTVEAINKVASLVAAKCNLDSIYPGKKMSKKKLEPNAFKIVWAHSSPNCGKSWRRREEADFRLDCQTFKSHEVKFTLGDKAFLTDDGSMYVVEVVPEECDPVDKDYDGRDYGRDVPGKPGRQRVLHLVLWASAENYVPSDTNTGHFSYRRTDWYETDVPGAYEFDTLHMDLGQRARGSDDPKEYLETEQQRCMDMHFPAHTVKATSKEQLAKVERTRSLNSLVFVEGGRDGKEQWFRYVPDSLTFNVGRRSDDGIEKDVENFRKRLRKAADMLLLPAPKCEKPHEPHADFASLEVEDMVLFMFGYRCDRSCCYGVSEWTEGDSVQHQNTVILECRENHTQRKEEKSQWQGWDRAFFDWRSGVRIDNHEGKGDVGVLVDTDDRGNRTPMEIQYRHCRPANYELPSLNKPENDTYKWPTRAKAIQEAEQTFMFKYGDQFERVADYHVASHWKMEVQEGILNLDPHGLPPEEISDDIVKGTNNNRSNVLKLHFRTLSDALHFPSRLKAGKDDVSFDTGLHKLWLCPVTLPPANNSKAARDKCKRQAAAGAAMIANNNRASNPNPFNVGLKRFKNVTGTEHTPAFKESHPWVTSFPDLYMDVYRPCMLLARYIRGFGPLGIGVNPPKPLSVGGQGRGDEFLLNLMTLLAKESNNRVTKPLKQLNVPAHPLTDTGDGAIVYSCLRQDPRQPEWQTIAEIWIYNYDNHNVQSDSTNQLKTDVTQWNKSDFTGLDVSIEHRNAVTGKDTQVTYEVKRGCVTLGRVTKNKEGKFIEDTILTSGATASDLENYGKSLQGDDTCYFPWPYTKADQEAKLKVGAVRLDAGAVCQPCGPLKQHACSAQAGDCVHQRHFPWFNKGSATGALDPVQDNAMTNQCKLQQDKSDDKEFRQVEWGDAQGQAFYDWLVDSGRLQIISIPFTSTQLLKNDRIGALGQRTSAPSNCTNCGLPSKSTLPLSTRSPGALRYKADLPPKRFQITVPGTLAAGDGSGADGGGDPNYPDFKGLILLVCQKESGAWKPEVTFDKDSASYTVELVLADKDLDEGTKNRLTTNLHNRLLSTNADKSLITTVKKDAASVSSDAPEWEFTPGNDIEVRILCDRTVDAMIQVKFDVTDTGTPSKIQSDDADFQRVLTDAVLESLDSVDPDSKTQLKFKDEVTSAPALLPDGTPSKPPKAHVEDIYTHYPRYKDEREVLASIFFTVTVEDVECRLTDLDGVDEQVVDRLKAIMLEGFVNYTWDTEFTSKATYVPEDALGLVVMLRKDAVHTRQQADACVRCGDGLVAKALAKPAEDDDDDDGVPFDPVIEAAREREQRILVANRLEHELEARLWHQAAEFRRAMVNYLYELWQVTATNNMPSTEVTHAVIQKEVDRRFNEQLQNTRSCQDCHQAFIVGAFMVNGAYDARGVWYCHLCWDATFAGWRDNEKIAAVQEEGEKKARAKTIRRMAESSTA